MKPHAAPPPPGAQPPPLWGSEDHVRELLGDRIEQVQTATQTLRVTHFASPEAFRDYFKSNYGPTISAYRFIADDPDRVAALDHDLAELGRFDVGTDSFVLIGSTCCSPRASPDSARRRLLCGNRGLRVERCRCADDQHCGSRVDAMQPVSASASASNSKGHRGASGPDVWAAVIGNVPRRCPG
jgi:hypothetical protein